MLVYLGTGVITGSPPNLVVPEVMERFGDSHGLTFASWMAFAVPVMCVNLIISWLWISFIGWRQERQHRIPGNCFLLFYHFLKSFDRVPIG